jgi:hypothetical protein
MNANLMLPQRPREPLRSPSSRDSPDLDLWQTEQGVVGRVNHIALEEPLVPACPPTTLLQPTYRKSNLTTTTKLDANTPTSH